MRSPFLLFSAMFLGLSLSAQGIKVVNEQVVLEKVEEYESCQQRDYSGSLCHDALVRWVEAHPTDQFKAGKMTRKIMNASAAVPFFAKAFESKKGDCKDKDVKLAVVSGVSLPVSSNRAVVDQAKKIGFELCYTDMKDSLIEATSESYAFDNTCSELVAKGALTGLKAKKCTAKK